MSEKQSFKDIKFYGIMSIIAIIGWLLMKIDCPTCWECPCWNKLLGITMIGFACSLTLTNELVDNK